MRSFLTATALVTFALGTPAAFAQDGTPLGAAEVESFLTNTTLLGAETANVANVSADGDTVTAENVAMSWQLSLDTPEGTGTLDFSLSIPQMQVVGLRTTAGGHAASLMEFPILNFAFEASPPEGIDGGASYEFTVEDYRFVDAVWATFPTIVADATKPVSRFAPLVDWVVSFGYQENSIAGLTGFSDIDGDRQEITYGPLSFGPVVNGRLENYEYGPVTQTQTVGDADDGMEIAVSYGRTTGRGLDIKPLAAFLSGNGGGEGPQPIMESLLMDGVSITGGDEFKVSMGDIVVENMTVDPRGPGLLAQLDPLVIAAMTGVEPNPLELINLALDVYGAFGFGAYIFNDIEVSAEDASGRLAQAAMEGVSRNGIELLGINGLAVDAAGFDMRLGSFRVADFVFPAREAVMELGLQSMMGVEPDPAMVLSVIPTLGEIALEGVSSVVPGEASRFELDTASVSFSDYIATIPTNMNVVLRGLEMPAALIQEPQALAALRAMNADPLQVDGTISVRWDEDSRRLELNKDIAVGNAGSIKADAVLSGIPRTVFEDPMTAQEAMATAALSSISATFTNAGVADYLIDLMSTQTGVSKDDFANAIATQAQMQISMLTGSQEFASTVSSAVRAFLTDPKQLVVSMMPEQPVTFAELIGTAMTAPNALPDLLRFEVIAVD